MDELREGIEAIDARLVDLLNERARRAVAIGARKRAGGDPFYVPERERRVLDRVTGVNRGPLGDDALRTLYREIISASRALERPTEAAFLGPEDTFSHMAALRVFGASAVYHPLATFDDIFTEVERGRIDYGIVPVESAMGGAVHDVLDLFIESPLKIINEVTLRIEQNLMARCPLEEVARVYSKDNALAQCRNWLRANLPRAEAIALPSTAEAARRAAGEKGAAAIASRLAATRHDLPILAEGIEDEKQNFTRFLVLGRQGAAPTGDDKTSMIVTLKDKPGALQELLSPFAEEGVTLTRIESRPSRRQAWEYVFFIDCRGHAGDERVAGVLRRVGELAFRVKVLGSFPRAAGPE